MKRILSVFMCLMLVVPIAFLSGCDDGTITINVYNVGDYIDEEVITLFEEEKLPEWFNQNIKKEEISSKEEQTLKDMLKEFL